MMLTTKRDRCASVWNVDRETRYQCDLTEGHGGEHSHALAPNARVCWPNGDDANERLRSAEKRLRSVERELDIERTSAVNAERSLHDLGEMLSEHQKRADSELAIERDMRIAADAQRATVEAGMEHAFKLRDKAVANVAELLGKLDQITAENQGAKRALAAVIVSMHHTAPASLIACVHKAIDLIIEGRRAVHLAEEYVLTRGAAREALAELETLVDEQPDRPSVADGLDNLPPHPFCGTARLCAVCQAAKGLGEHRDEPPPNDEDIPF